MIYTTDEDGAILLIPVLKAHNKQFISSQNHKTKTWLEANQFTAESGQICSVANAQGEVEAVYIGLADKMDFWAYAKAVKQLPAAKYQIKAKLSKEAMIYWGLAQYQFSKYKATSKLNRTLVVAKSQIKEVSQTVESIALIRTLINTPAEDMGPKQLAEALKDIAESYQAEFSELIGNDLLAQNFPAVHVVGRASSREPRLLRMRWGKKQDPLICLVGKGVCFDSGGLDLKPSSGMRNMKKDMGGAAHVIGLAKLIMSMKLPIQLEVIVAAVENSVSANAYRPGDVVKTRKGLSVEIGNTDAEGRVILADALTLASELKPKLIIDFATLTGAARVALGLDVAAMFSNQQPLASELQTIGQKIDDPLWQLPLYQPYNALIKPEIADLSNSGESPFGGAITAALFLEHFVHKKIPWIHFDIMAWNISARPGKPKGGEALAIRAVYEFLKKYLKQLKN